MQKKSKADIKKMIAELHQKPNGDGKAAQPIAGQANNSKASKGVKQSGSYRTKI